jgi:hypothetical protein
MGVLEVATSAEGAYTAKPVRFSAKGSAIRAYCYRKAWLGEGTQHVHRRASSATEARMSGSCQILIPR